MALLSVGRDNQSNVLVASQDTAKFSTSFLRDSSGFCLAGVKQATFTTDTPCDSDTYSVLETSKVPALRAEGATDPIASVSR